MSRVALADVLWDAANKHLTYGRQGARRNVRDSYSCYAVSLASGDGYGGVVAHYERSQPVQFLYELGCEFDATSVWGNLSASKLQSVRYMWLLLAACVAEDEGIVIERGAA